MKKIIITLTIALVLMSNYTFAQIINQTDTKIVGGAASFAYTSTTEAYSSNVGQVQIVPLYGNFLNNQFFLGVAGNFQVTASDYSSPDYILAVSPLVRYYFADNSFLGAEIGVGTSISGGENTPLYLWNATIGKDFPISKSVFLELALGYGKTYYEPDGGPAATASNLRLSFGVVATLGSNNAPNNVVF